MKETVVVIVDTQNASKEEVIDLMLAVYVSEKCRYCEHEYESTKDIRERGVVYAGPYMLACKKCFDENNPS